MSDVGVALVVCGSTLLAARWWFAFLEARDARRHGWRLELVRTKSDAFKAEALEEMKQRVQRLELRQGVQR